MRAVSIALPGLASADKPQLDGIHRARATLPVPLTEARDAASDVVPGSWSPRAANSCPRPSVRFGSRPFSGYQGRYRLPWSFQSLHMSSCARSPALSNGTRADAWRRCSSRTMTPRAQGPETPVQKAEISGRAKRKAVAGTTETGPPVHSLRANLRDLGDPTCDEVTLQGQPDHPFAIVAQPTPVQAEAFRRLGVEPSEMIPVPLQPCR